MIFVVIGTSSWNFDRLIKALDEIAPSLDEKVIMQIGNSNYVPVNSEYFRFRSKEEVDKIYKNADIIVCHAGIGSILSTAKYKKDLIIVPRRRKYGELLDDHQAEIARKLEKRGIIIVWDVKDLETIIRQMKKTKMYAREEREKLVSSLKRYLSNIKL